MPDTAVSLCTSHRSSSGTPWDCRSSPFGEITSLVWYHAAEIWFPFYSILLHTTDPRVRTSVPYSSVHSFILFFRNIEVERKLRKENRNSQIINHGSVLLTEHWFCVRHVHEWAHIIPIETRLTNMLSVDTAYNRLDTGYLDHSIILLI